MNFLPKLKSLFPEMNTDNIGTYTLELQCYHVYSFGKPVVRVTFWTEYLHNSDLNSKEIVFSVPIGSASIKALLDYVGLGDKKVLSLKIWDEHPIGMQMEVVLWDIQCNEDVELLPILGVTHAK